MSTSFNVAIIYGFPFKHAELPKVEREHRGRRTMEPMEEWEIAEAYDAPNVSQHNAGRSNGGEPDFFLGVVVVQVRDCTRGRAWVRVGTLAVSPSDEAAVARVAAAVGKDAAQIGFYLTGDAA